MRTMAKELTLEDNARKKQASVFLKNADKFLKSGEFALALEEIDKTLEIDPKNFYARAYKDRLASMQKHAQTASKSGGSLPPIEVAPEAFLLPGTDRAKQEKKSVEQKRA